MDKIEQIQLFLQGRLNGEPLERFEEQLKQDKDLQKMVAEYDTIFKGFSQLRRAKLTKKVEEWGEDLPDLEIADKAPVVRNMWWQRAAVAAVVVIALAGLGALLFKADHPLDDFKQENYISLALSLEKSAVQAPAAIAFHLAEINFERQAYPDCITQLDQIQNTDSLYLKALYLKGHAFYQSQKYLKAIGVFKQLEQVSPTTNFHTRNYNSDNATWTKLLAQLALYEQAPSASQKQKLEQELNAFLNKKPAQPYREKATALGALLTAEE